MSIPPDSDLPDPSVGMGSTPSGPSFAPGGSQPWWSQPPGATPPGPAPLGPAPLRRPEPATFAAPHSRLPAVLTVIVVGVVGLVVVLATIMAHRADQQAAVPAAPASAPSTPHVTATKDSIDFTTSSGTGRLTILDHTWQDAQTDQGSALLVRVRLVCTTGTVGYDPFDFQAFDAAGNLFDLAAEEARGPILGVGTLAPGEQVSGTVAFVIPRGEVTLLMSDDASSVTALKIPD